jgi:hypothetical protein
LCSGSSTRSTQLTISAVVAESTDDVVVDWSASISPTAGSEVEQLYSDFLDTGHSSRGRPRIRASCRESA